jgi:hypothetical protein
LASTPQKL